MKRKNLVNLISLVLLSVAALYILIEHKKASTLPERLTEFAFTDTASIIKIFMADMKGNTVVLQKDEGKWKVNNKYKANEERIQLLMDVLYKLKVKSPTPESALKNVIKDMASNSVKVEIYTHKKKPVKVIYVGGPTPDLEGTYMALALKRKKEKVPYIVYIPDFRGYLSEGYFFTGQDDWRTKEVFMLNPLNIESVQLEYSQAPRYSFNLTAPGNQSFEISNPACGNIPADSIDVQQVKKFLMGFENLQFVAIDTDISSEKKDSVIKSIPAAHIITTLRNKESHELWLYNKPSDTRTRVETGNGFDKERFYGLMPERKNQLLILQTLSLKRILWKYDDFKIKN